MVHFNSGRTREINERRRRRRMRGCYRQAGRVVIENGEGRMLTETVSV